MADRISDGFRAITPHLVVRGAAKAIEFYKQAFGATERYAMPWKGSDGATKIGHAELMIGDSVVMLADEFPEYGSVAPSGGGANVVIHFRSPDVDATMARAVEAGATITMPIENAFWGERYGKLIDPFGHHWSISTTIEEVSREEAQKRAEALFSGGGGCGD